MTFIQLQFLVPFNQQWIRQSPYVLQSCWNEWATSSLLSISEFDVALTLLPHFLCLIDSLFKFWVRYRQINMTLIMVVSWQNFDLIKHRAPTLTDGMDSQTFTTFHHFLFKVLSRLQLSLLPCTFFYPSFPFSIKHSISVLGHRNLVSGGFFINGLLCLQPPPSASAHQWLCPGQRNSQLSSTWTRLRDHVEVQKT